MPSVRSVRFDPNKEDLAGLRDCCLLTEAHALERIPGWHYVSARRTRMSKGGVGGWWLGQRYPLAWYMVESEPAAHRCDRLWGLAIYSSHPLPRPSPLTLLLYTPLRTPHHPPCAHTQSLFSTVIHAAHLQCFQERQIKRGFSYRSVTLELRASWITINSIKRRSLRFAPSPATTREAWPCHCSTSAFIYTIAHLTTWFLKVPHLPGEKQLLMLICQTSEQRRDFHRDSRDNAALNWLWGSCAFTAASASG